MVTRSLIFAAFCASATLAHAGPIDSGAAAGGPSVTITQMDKVNAMLRNSPDAGGDWRLNSQSSGRAGAAAKIYTSTSMGGAWRGPEAPYLTLKALERPMAAGAPLNPLLVQEAFGPIRSSAVDVPEPATGLLLMAGLLGAGFASRRRRK